MPDTKDDEKYMDDIPDSVNDGDDGEEVTTMFDTSTSSSSKKHNPPSYLGDTNYQRSSTHVPVLMVLEGDNIGERYALGKEVNVLGRREDCEVFFPDRKLSRRHSRINVIATGEHISDFQVTITDLDSTNGTYLNGKRLRGTADLTDGDKILIGSTLLGFFIKFAEEMELENRLLKLATRDTLTNLYNRAFFNPTLSFEFKRSKRYARDLSLIMFDLDYFKKVNDTYGHLAGDVVLKEVGRIMINTLRAHDIPVRYGGEEFAIILIESTFDQAIACAERLRTIIEETEFKTADETLHVTASFGVSFCNDKTKSPDDLIKEADKALYYAKYAGRNNVKISGEVSSESTDTVDLE